MRLRGLMKLNARRALRGSWSKAVALAILLMAVFILFMFFDSLLFSAFNLPDYMDYFSTPELAWDDLPNASLLALAVVSSVSILCLLVVTPLKLGMTSWFFHLGNGQSEEFSSVFEFFSTPRLMAKSIWLWVATCFRCLFWGLLFMLPSLSLGVFSFIYMEAARSKTETLLATGALGCTVFLTVASALFVVAWCLKYALAPYYMVTDPTCSARRCLRLSKDATKGHLGELLALEISLLGWRVFALFGVTQLYTIPYIYTVKGIFGRYLMQTKLSAPPTAFDPQTQMPPMAQPTSFQADGFSV